MPSPRAPTLLLRPLAEPMEARVLHSADLGAFGLGAAAIDHQLLAVAEPSSALAQRHEIAFIDAGLPGADELRADLLAQQAAGRPIEIIDIAANEDGIALITQTLAGRDDIGAVHVLGHSSDGWLLLGNQVLDGARLFSRAGEIAGWSDALTADADLLLYGCDLAQSAGGVRFVQDLAALTGADVAASADATGAAARGGDWALEVQTGAIEAALAPSLAAQAQWSGLLAVFVADPNAADGAVGSLRWAIDQANASPSNDTIRLLAGTHQIQLNGDEDANASGDFDVIHSVTFVGAGANAADTVVRGNGNDRVFDLLGGNVSFRDLTVTGGGNVSNGGGIHISNAPTVDLQNVVVDGNAANNGGNIFNQSTLTLSQVTISRGIAGNGGGLANRGQATLTDVWFDNNWASGSGGGMSQQGGATSAVLTNVTFSNNNTLASGGGVHGNGGSMSGVNVTFSGNSAGVYGGAISVNAIGWTLTNAVITGNSAVFGGDGIYSNGTPITLGNSILADNNGVNANQAQISANYNIDTDGSAGLTGANDSTPSSAALRLGALAQNGGYTPTHALLAGSVAIDAGDPAASATDQRGYVRVGTADIGAYEFGAAAAGNRAPTGGVTVSGTAQQGQTLSASNTLADADGLGTISYQWSANGAVLAGATGNTLSLTQAHVGARISVAASYTDGRGTIESVSSTQTANVANVNDAPSGSVTISGAAQEGQTLSASNTLSDADGLGTISYQWFANGAPIGGAAGNTLTLTQAQVGARISVAARYTDGQGTAESVSSAQTSNVANVNDAPSGSVTIAGTSQQGQTLSAFNTLADADGLGPVAYQWFANGAAIASATGTTLTLAQSQVGTRISVAASYTDGQGTAESVSSAQTANVANVNDAPSGSVTISGAAQEDQTLSASNTLADADGLGTIAYQWLADGAAIAGATGTTLTLTQSLVGTRISVFASYTDGQGSAESVTSAQTATVTNGNDAPTGSVSVSGTAQQGQTLSASNTLADADGLGAISYQWFANGSAIGGASGTTLTLTQAQVGTRISVAASYIDGQGTAESVASAQTANVANVNDAPTGSVTVSGTAQQGQTLSASNTLADADGLGTISYQWFANGAVIAGATGTTLALTQAQVGTRISVAASYTDSQGTAESVVSAQTANVANVNDAPSGSVTVSGTAQQGQTLSASNTLADADGLGTISYQWFANGAAIAGATGTTLTLTQAQVGTRVSVAASYIDGQGTRRVGRQRADGERRQRQRRAERQRDASAAPRSRARR